MSPITGSTRLLGVIGYPISHTLSPLMHNAAIEQLGLDYKYVPFAVAPADLAAALAGFAAIGVVGCSVTIPHKQAIVPLLAGITPLATAVGAVNTIWHTEAGWCGTNTDVAGFIAPLLELNRDWQHTTALILGNGGAARAVVAGCHQLGCGNIRVFGRDPVKLAEFGTSWQQIALARHGGDTPEPIVITTHDWQELGNFTQQNNLLIVNSTPSGMYPHIDASPIGLEMFAGVGANSIAYDLIYTPRPTKFLSLAADRGLMAIDGVEMLVQQGAIAFKLWLQQSPPVAVMRDRVVAHLQAARST